jgi:fibronectin-binding autotransporter adhesin
MNIFGNSQNTVRASLLLASLAVPLPALAANKSYVGSDGGLWSNGGNWAPVNVPLNGDNVFLQPGAGDRTVNLDFSYVAPGLASLFIDGQNFSTATVSQSGNAMVVSGQEQIGVNPGGHARYLQQGGTHTGTQMILGLLAGSSGTYELSGAATLNMNANSLSYTSIGGSGSGTFTQTGGTHNVYNLYIGGHFAGGQGTYTISNGTVNATIVNIGDPASGYFQQSGGTVNATVMNINSGGQYNMSDGALTVTSLNNTTSYSQSRGLFSGAINNTGNWGLSGGFVSLTGAGFTNNANVNLSGGTVSTSSAPFNNNSQIYFYNNPSISGANNFNNLGILSQGSGILTISSPGFNSGNVNLAAGGGLALNAANFTNTGTINLGNGRISATGGAQLVNRYGATITGSGLIFGGFDNQGGRLLLTSGTTVIPSPFNSRGIIELTDNAASLSGGAITNTGQVIGHGSVSNDIINSTGSSIEANGGTLILGGVLTNSASGTMVADPSSKLFLAGGMNPNAGLINLQGGTFDTNGIALTSTGQISGFGTIRTGGTGLTNNGSMTLTGGFTTVLGNVTNGGGKQLRIAYNPALFTGNVVNNGLIKTTSTTVTFSGIYTENGTFNSDPSDTYFMSVTMGGTWTGGVGDRFFIKGALDWIGGAMSGSGGETFNQGLAALHEPTIKTLSGWTFNNEKPLTIVDGNLNMGNGALINNTSTFDFISDISITNTLGGSAAFSNSATGTLRKSGGAGTSNVAALVSNNNGAIDVQNGTLSLTGGLNITAGTSLPKTGGGTLRISGPQAHGAGANLNVLAGNVRLASNAGVAATGTPPTAAVHNLNINVTGNNTALILESSTDVGNLTVPFANAGNQSLDLNTPSTPGAFNAIRVYASDLASAKTTLWSAIKNANAPGSLTPIDGIYDSGKAAHGGTGIGLARINDAHGDSHVEIRLARIGDLNLDGSVTISDFIDLASNFNSSAPTVTWQEGDLNYDGSVTISDFIDLASNFNSSYSGDVETVAGFASSIGLDPSIIGSAVPEPSILSLLSFVSLGAASRTLCRRRKLAHR